MALFVAPPSIRLWILKGDEFEVPTATKVRCTPFDPLVDTERDNDGRRMPAFDLVAPPSIRLWILKAHGLPRICTPAH